MKRIPSSRSIRMDLPSWVVERALESYAEAYGFAFAALRYFNASGASPDGDIGEDHTPESHLIPIALQVALGQRDKLTIFGDDYPTPDGTCVRDYIHVDDLGDAHIKAMDILSEGKGLKLNLGVGQGYSVQQVVDACRQATGTRNSGGDGRATSRRSARAGGRQPTGQQGFAMAAEVHRFERHRSDGMEVAQHPSERLCLVVSISRYDSAGEEAELRTTAYAC